jgi:hypothetical protein
MKLALVENGKEGFARYCPTFKNAFDGFKEFMDKKCSEWYSSKMIRINRKIVSGETERLAKSMARSEKKVKLVATLLLWGMNGNVKARTAELLMDAGGKGADLTSAVPIMIEAMEDFEVKHSSYLIGALSQALISEKSREAAAKALGEAFQKWGGRTKAYSAMALADALLNGVDIPGALPALDYLIGHDDTWATRRIADLMGSSFPLDRSVLDRMVNRIHQLVSSEWFTQEAEANSTWYEETSAEFGRILLYVEDNFRRGNGCVA